MKILIDTNVILDFLLDSREPFHEMAVRALKLMATHGMTCCITDVSGNRHLLLPKKSCWKASRKRIAGGRLCALRGD